MSCVRNQGGSEVRLTTTTTTEAVQPISGFVEALGVDKVRAVIKCLAEDGNFQCRLAYQTATAVTTETGSGGRSDWTAIGSQNVGEGMFEIEEALTLGTNQFVRFGIAYSLTSGTALGQAEVAASFSTPSCGKTLGSASYELSADNTGYAFQGVTEWMPALNMEIIRVAHVVVASTGNFQTQIAIQTADVSVMTPNDFDNIGTVRSGDVKVCEEINVDATLNPGTNQPMWFRVGVAHRISSGSTEEVGTASIHVTGKRKE